MKLKDLINLNSNMAHFAQLDIESIQTNSRLCDSKSIFVCIKGYVTDGHKYIPDAISRGTRVILMQDDGAKPSDTANSTQHQEVLYISLPDTRAALGPLCAKLYDDPSSKLSLIGITGTKGKTTTSYLVRSIFTSAHINTGLIGTMYNIIGTKQIPAVRTTPEANEIQPMLVQMLEAGSKACIMEVSSQGLHLSRVGGLRFNTAIFTNLSRDHIGENEHANMEEYAAAKAKLFTMCDNAIINIDNDYSEVMLDSARKSQLHPEIYTFSTNADKKADFTAINIQKHPDSVSYDIVNNKQTIISHIQVPIPGLFTVYNSMCAFIVAYIAGIDLQYIKDGLSNVFVPGKAENVPTGRDFSVLIDYAHNPDSIANIIDTVKEYARRTVIVFGCGGDRNRPRALMGKTAGEHADFTIITSDNPRSEDPESIVRDIEEGIKQTDGKYICIVDRRKAIEYAIDNAQPGDVIILAGKGHETEQIFKDHTIHFDEREVVAQALGKVK